MSINPQSMIPRSLDNDAYVLLAISDLNLAFDVIDINLLLKRFKKHEVTFKCK
jgi:hypothetical protein